MAEIYIAETLQSRRWLAGQLLFSSGCHRGLCAVDVGTGGWLLRRVLRPMRQLSALMVRREPGSDAATGIAAVVGNAAADRGF